MGEQHPEPRFLWDTGINLPSPETGWNPPGHVSCSLNFNGLLAVILGNESDVQLFEVIRRFKEREIGRLVVMEGDRPVGMLTQSDIIRVFPSL